MPWFAPKSSYRARKREAMQQRDSGQQAATTKASYMRRKAALHGVSDGSAGKATGDGLNKTSTSLSPESLARFELTPLFRTVRFLMDHAATTALVYSRS